MILEDEQNDKKLTGYPSIDKPWLKYYSEEAVHAKVPECSMYQYLVEKNKENSEQTALIYYGRKISYGQFFERIREVAGAFYKRGIYAGDIVTLISLDTPETLYCIYALNYLGAVVNSVYISLSQEEIRKTVQETNSKMLIALEVVERKLTCVREVLKDEQILLLRLDTSMPLIPRLICRCRRRDRMRGKCLEWKEFLKGETTGHIEPVYRNNTAAVIVYTSGTTGEPKGVLLSNESINAVALQYEMSGLEFERGDTFLTFMPPFFAIGLSLNVHMPLSLGMQEILFVDLSPGSIPQAYANIKPNHFVAAPNEILQIKNIIKNRMDYCKTIAGGGESLGHNEVTNLNTFLRERGAHSKYITGYGMSELAATVTTVTDKAYKTGSIGIPLCMVNTKIVTQGTEVELQYGKEGEICFDAPNRMLSYLNNKDATDEVCCMHNDGRIWVHTGDLGYIDEDGFLFFTGRLKRIYMTRGEDGTIYKIFPVRVEELIGSVQEVKKCAVAVVEDEQLLHRQIAYVVLEDGVKQEKVLQKVRNLCEENLPQHSVPWKYEAVRSLPLTAMGKVDYRKLEEAVATGRE